MGQMRNVKDQPPHIITVIPYAWNVIEGGSSTNTWLNQMDGVKPNLSKYWTNDAYTSTANVGDHEKIFFSSGDHSATTISTPGKVRSKWGSWPLFEHSTAKCPYISTSLSYYHLKNPTIYGSSDVLCSNTQRIFNTESMPTG